MVNKIKREGKINLMFFMSSYGLGGYEVTFKNLINSFNKDIFNITIVLCYPSYKAKNVSEELRQKYFKYLWWDDIQRTVIKTKFLFDIRDLLKIIKLMKNSKSDGILYFAMGTSSFLAPIAAKLAKLKFIVRRAGTTCRGIYPEIFRGFDKYLMSKTDIIILTNKFLQDEIENEMKVDPEKIKVIPTGADLNQFKVLNNKEKLKERLGLEKEYHVVGCIANLTLVKNHEVLIKAAFKILRSFPKTYFLLIGEGPRREILEKLSRELGISEKIKFLGHREDIKNIIPTFDVGVLCSKIEAHGISLIEIMACGVPVVASNIGGIPNIVKHQKSGLLFPVGDSEKLANGIEIFLNDKKLAKEYGSYSRSYVYKNFTKDIMVKGYQDIIIDLYNKNE